MQINFRSKIGKYLMAKAVELERRKLRFLNNAVVIICASCFLHKMYLKKQCY